MTAVVAAVVGSTLGSPIKALVAGLVAPHALGSFGHSLSPLSLTPLHGLAALGGHLGGGLGLGLGGLGGYGLTINDEALSYLFGLHAVMKATQAYLKLKHVADKQWAPIIGDLKDIKIGSYD